MDAQQLYDYLKEQKDEWGEILSYGCQDPNLRMNIQLFSVTKEEYDNQDMVRGILKMLF